MKKLLIVMSIIVILVCQAAAEGLSVADVWLNNEAAALIPAGVEAQCTRTEFPFSLPNERQAVSVSLTAEGNLKFGRYDQVTHTALLDAITGEKIELEEVFSDLEVLQDYLNTYVEQNVMDLLNTYLDATDICLFQRTVSVLMSMGLLSIIQASAFGISAGMLERYNCSGMNLQII